MIKPEQIEEFYENAIWADIPMYFKGIDTSDGYKLSIQGKSKEDVLAVLDRIGDYLCSRQIPFKFATKRRVEHKDTIQSRKIVTIYIPNNMYWIEEAETIYALIKDYKGWYDIKRPHGYKHYAGAIYYRNDRDAKGNYINAKDAKDE